MPTWIDHILFGLLAVLFPVWAMAFGFRRLQLADAPQVPRVRRSVYRRAIAVQWTLSAALIALWILEARGWAELGLVPRLTSGLLGVAVGLAIVVPFAVRQRRQIVADEEARAGVRARLRRLERLMPRDDQELAAYGRLAVTAGVCEELLYRGFMIWYLGHWLGLLPAAMVAAAVFGIGHSYQGWRGVLVTAAVGAFLGLVYLLTGSLLASMVIHAAMDIHSGYLGYVAFTRAPEERAEADPAQP